MTTPCGTMTLAEMRANVARSEGHVTRQHEIIHHLTQQGHAEMATQATELLATMNVHLAVEIDILARMEANDRIED